LKSIDTLVQDIYGLFSDDQTPPFSEGSTQQFANDLSKRISERIAEARQARGLRLSNIGKPCTRQLYYGVHNHEEAEPLPPEARIKFLFGDILEEQLLWLAREAGHTVTDEQKEVTLHGVKGHIDGRIDGVLVDCKSASTYSYNRFAVGLSPFDDPFGYLGQLDAYLHAEDEGRNQETFGAFLVIDKTMGKICLDKHPKSNVNWKGRIHDLQEALSKSTPPPRRYSSEPEGKSGNEKLGVECSYCPFKRKCWPGLRVFAYSTGPRFLTKVVREPDVPEIT